MTRRTVATIGAGAFALSLVIGSAGTILAVGDDQTIPDWMAHHMRAHMGAAADQMSSMMGSGSMMSGQHSWMMSGQHSWMMSAHDSWMMSGEHGWMLGQQASPESGQ
jgi:hypothetical protein